MDGWLGRDTTGLRKRDVRGSLARAGRPRETGRLTDFNHTLKRICRSAATTVLGRAEDEPLAHHYEPLLEGGTKPKPAKLTLARQIARTC